MYKCEKCNSLVRFDKNSKKTRSESSKLRTALKLIVQTRPKTYKNKIRRGKKTVVTTTTGWEIAKELQVCKKCHGNFRGKDEHRS